MNPTFRPDAYLIARAQSGLRWTAGLTHGFALVAVQRVGGRIMTSEGETVSGVDEPRFLFVEDAERAVARGIASRDGNQIIGVRYPALAGFVHLRLRDLPDRGQSSTDPPRHNSDPGGAKSVDQVAVPIDAEPPANSASPTRPARVRRPRRPARTTSGEAADSGAGRLPRAKPGEAVDDLLPHGSSEEPQAEETGESDKSGIPTVDGAIERARLRVEQLGMPAIEDLEVLSDNEVACRLLLADAAGLSTALQVELADSMAVLLLSSSRSSQLAYEWLQATADRVQGQSRDLITLLGAWLDFDAAGGLQQLRQHLRRGTISLDQRRPVEVALLLRKAAQSLGDADALRESYASLAMAPSRSRDADALISLLSDIQHEEGPTESELDAIGLPILIQAFEVADDGQLVALGIRAESLVRRFLRQDPANLTSAAALEPLIARALDCATAEARGPLENIMRELLSASQRSDQRKVRAPAVATTYEELLRMFDGRSNNVEIVEEAFASARTWGRDGREQLEALRDALEAVVDVADRYAAQDLGSDGLLGAFARAGHTLIPAESETTQKDPKARRAHTVRNRRNQPIELGPHLKFADGKRLYLALDTQRRRLYVGWVGDHLPVGRHMNRAR